MATTLQFIDHSNIDHKSRRIIRSHVMKGKNVGKVRASRHAPQTEQYTNINGAPTSYLNAKRSSYSNVSSHCPTKDAAYAEESDICPKLVAQVGNELSGLGSPCEVTTHSKRVMLDFLFFVSNSVYPPDFCSTKPDPNLTVWFQYAFEDEAFFHGFCALSEATMDLATGKENTSLGYRQHMATALRLINDKLSSSNAVADTNLAGVILLCLLSSVRDQPLRTKIHFDGLCRMIEVRGGMDQLKDNPAIIEKAHRVDIDLALQLGCATKLGSSAKHIDEIVPIFSNPAFEVRSPLINAARNADHEVFAAAQDIMKLSRIFNSGVAAKKLGHHAFYDMITVMCYRLLENRSLDARRCDMHPVANAIQLGLIAFMTTFLLQIGGQRRARYDLIACKFMKALDNPRFRTAVDPGTHLWLLVIGGISVLGREDRLWLKPCLVKAVQHFGVTNWDFARRLLSKYPWISSFHEQQASHLWHFCFPAENNIAE